jgi:hypothetical protein
MDLSLIKGVLQLFSRFIISKVNSELEQARGPNLYWVWKKNNMQMYIKTDKQQNIL